MKHYVIIDSQQQIHLIDETELDFVSQKEGYKILKEGSEKICKKFYDDFVEESGYTGPIWDKLELND